MAEEIRRKINILETHSSLGYAGGQRNLATFAKYLDKELFNVFALGYLGGGVQEERLTEMGIEAINGGGNIEMILKFIEEKNIDVIHIHRSGGHNKLETAIIDGAKKINPQIVIIEKNVFGKFDPVSGGEIDCHMFQSMMHLNERYLPASGEAFDFSRHKVMYNMVDVQEFEKYRLTSEQIREAKKNLGILEDDFVIGKIARPHIAKWSDLILDMMPHLIKIRPKTKFIIVGAPESRRRKIENSSLKDHFILLDEITDERQLHEIYQIIDVLAHSSKIGECNGNTINEAMFWAKPVVINSTPNRDNGQLEQVIHMENGLIANYPQTYARALAYLANNPEKSLKMGENGRKQVLSINNPQLISSALTETILELLSKRGISVKLDNINLTFRRDLLPNEAMIEAYKIEYRKRLGREFDQLSLREKIINLLWRPKKFLVKLMDYLEAKSQ